MEYPHFNGLTQEQQKAEDHIFALIDAVGKVNAPPKRRCIYCNLEMSETECLMHPKKPIFKFRINVPSGKLIFANFFKRRFEEISDKHNINEVHGMYDEATEWESYNIGYVQTGNDAAVVSSENGHLRVRGFSEYSSLDDSIDMSMWRIMFMDYQQFLDQEEVIGGEDSVIVDLDPGRYLFTWYGTGILWRDSWEHPDPWVTFTKIS